MEDTLQIIRDSLGNFFGTFAASIPRLISGLILLIIGWVIARIIRWGVHKALKIMQFDGLVTRLGVSGYLMKGGIKTTGSILIANLVYWAIMLVMWTAFFNTLGLELVSDLLNKVILYIPNIIVAFLLMVLGMYLAEFASGVVVAAGRSAEIENAGLFGRLTNGFVLFFVFALVLHQLGIGKELIQTMVGIVFGSAGLALALAFGLGGREWAARVIDKYSKKE